MIGQRVSVIVDRPLGSTHPKHRDIIYPVNYGYIPGFFAPDGEELDVYVLGVEQPIREFTGLVIAILRREDDVEDKLVVAPQGMWFSNDEILEKVSFQERFFETRILTESGTQPRYLEK